MFNIARNIAGNIAGNIASNIARCGCPFSQSPSGMTIWVSVGVGGDAEVHIYPS